MSVDSEYPLAYNLEKVELNLHTRVIDTIQKSRQLSPRSKERFGVLIGTKSATRNAYWLEAVTAPAATDQSSRSSFLMQSPQHQAKLDARFSQSNGEQIYLGTWHTHPEVCPTPSSIDKRDWRQCQRRNRGRQLFFIIAGTEEIKVYIKRRLSYVPMKTSELSP